MPWSPHGHQACRASQGTWVSGTVGPCARLRLAPHAGLRVGPSSPQASLRLWHTEQSCGAGLYGQPCTAWARWGSWRGSCLPSCTCTERRQMGLAGRLTAPTLARARWREVPGRVGRVQGALRELESERGSQQRPGQVRRFPEKSADGARPACGEGRNHLPHGARRARGWGPHPPQPGSQWRRLRGSRGQSGQAGAGPRSRQEGWARVVLATARLPGQLPPGPAPRGCSRNTASKLTSRGSQASGGTPRPCSPAWGWASRQPRAGPGSPDSCAGCRAACTLPTGRELGRATQSQTAVTSTTGSALR